jgi:hypothetical protein
VGRAAAVSGARVRAAGGRSGLRARHTPFVARWDGRNWISGLGLGARDIHFVPGLKVAVNVHAVFVPQEVHELVHPTMGALRQAEVAGRRGIEEGCLGCPLPCAEGFPFALELGA